MKNKAFYCKRCNCYCLNHQHVCPQVPVTIKSFGYIYTLADNETGVIASNDAVEFSNNGQLYNISHAIGSNIIRVTNSGPYLVSYSVNVLGNPNTIIALSINNIIDNSTRIKALTANTHIFGNAILNLTKNDVIRVINDSNLSLELDKKPNVGAQLSLIQLS